MSMRVCGIINLEASGGSLFEHRLTSRTLGQVVLRLKGIKAVPRPKPLMQEPLQHSSAAFAGSTATLLFSLSIRAHYLWNYWNATTELTDD